MDHCGIIDKSAGGVEGGFCFCGWVVGGVFNLKGKFEKVQKLQKILEDPRKFWKIMEELLKIKKNTESSRNVLKKKIF